MGSILREVLLELLGDLCRPASTSCGSFDELLRGYIVNVYKKFRTKEELGRCLEKLKSTFSSLHESSKDVDDVAGSEVMGSNVVGTDIMLLYVEWIVFVLQCYSESLKDAMDRHRHSNQKATCSPDALNNVQSKALRASMDQVFLLGVKPQLHPGVGLPAKYALSDVSDIWMMCLQVGKSNNNTIFLKKVVDSLVLLYEMKESTIFREYIISHHFSAYAAALFQLAYNPETEIYKGYLKKLASDFPERFVREVFCLIAKNPKGTNPPKWLTFKCTMFLFGFIRKGGLKTCISSVIQGGSEDICDGQNHAVVESMGRLFCGFSSEKYYCAVLDQAVDIVSEQETRGVAAKPDGDLDRKVLVVLLRILENVSESHPVLFRDRFVRVVLKPLDVCSVPARDQASCEVVCEKDFSSCIKKLEFMLTFNRINSFLAPHLLPYSSLLFKLHLFTSSSISYLNSSVEEVIVSILDNVETCDAVSALKNFAGLSGFESSGLGEVCVMDGDLRFSLGASGGVRVVDGSEVVQSSPVLEECQHEVSCLMKVISLIKDQGVAIDVFLAALQTLCQFSCDDENSEKDILQEVIGRKKFDKDDCMKKMTVMMFVVEFIERFGDLCMTNADHIFPLCRTLMDRSINILKNSSGTEVQSAVVDFQNEILSFVISLLAMVLLEGKQATSEKCTLAEPILPHLKYLSDHHISQEVRIISYELTEAIATHGKLLRGKIYEDRPVVERSKGRSGRDAEAEVVEGCDVGDVVASRLQQTSLRVAGKDAGEVGGGVPDEKDRKPPIFDAGVSGSTGNGAEHLPGKHSNGSRKHKLIEEISSGERTYYDDINDFFATVGRPDEISCTPFRQTLVNVSSLQEPLKGAGLIQLRRLIDSKDPDVDAHKDLVLKICRSCLLSEDSYVYLGAIGALSSLATRDPNAVLPSLLEDYANNYKHNSADIKLKLGETLVKTVRSLGDMAVVYKDRLIATMFVVLKDEDSIVRSSTISNLAEVCKLLRFNLSSCLYEIFEVIRNVLKYERSVEVRRAAALLTFQMLQGTSRDTIAILGDFLAEFYRLLKDTYKMDCDEVVQLHIQLSLEELDKIMRNFLFPAPTFKKDIFILRPPK